MNPKQPLPLPSPRAAAPGREVSLHLWPAGEERRPLDWKGVQSLLVRRRKPLLLCFGIVMAHLLLALWMLAPLYRATATLKINTASTNNNETDLPLIGEITGAGETRSLTTQIEILGNDGVRSRAIALMKPADRAAVNTKSATVKAIPDTNLLNITTASRNPNAAAGFSNALAQSYLELSRSENGSQYGAARRYVGKQLQDARARLNGAREAIKKFKQSNGTVDLGAETQAQIVERDRIDSQRSQARADKEAALATLNNLRATLSNLPASVIASKTIAKSPQVTAKQASLTALETELITARREYSATAPEVRSLEERIAGLRRDLQNAAQTEVAAEQSTINPARTAAEQQIQALQGQVWSLEARGVALKALSKRLQSELARLPAREQTLGQLNTDLLATQQSYDTLNQKYQSLRASEAARVASGSLLFPAAIPGSADSRLTPVNLLGCALFAAILSLAIAALIDRIDSRVHSPRDLTVGGELPVLAQVPFALNASGQSLLQMESPVSPLLENFRGLRTMLALSTLSENGESVKSLAITSSLPKEGKSLTALNLAVAAARGGERVILVDCDLRRPSQHRLCNLSNRVGFINVAEGEVALEAALQESGVPGLRVLTSGPIASNPFHALNSRAGRELLRDLEQIADFVVIDTPPVLVLADARITASLTDSAILVVSTEEPDRTEVALAGDLLAQSGARVAGIVLNKVASGPDFRDYYSRYPYYTVAVGALPESGLAESGSPASGQSLRNAASNREVRPEAERAIRDSMREANITAHRETRGDAVARPEREVRPERSEFEVLSERGQNRDAVAASGLFHSSEELPVARETAAHSTIPEVAIPEVAVPEVETPKFEPVEAAVPETAAPEVETPEVTVFDATLAAPAPFNGNGATTGVSSDDLPANTFNGNGAKTESDLKAKAENGQTSGARGLARLRMLDAIKNNGRRSIDDEEDDDMGTTMNAYRPSRSESDD